MDWVILGIILFLTCIFAGICLEGQDSIADFLGTWVILIVICLMIWGVIDFMGRLIDVAYP